MQKFIAMLAEKLAGRIVTKLVTAAAAALVAHSLMKPEQQGAWITSNADWLTGLALTGLSFWMSRWQQTKQKEAVETALWTPVPGTQGPTQTNVQKLDNSKPSRILPLLAAGLLAVSLTGCALFRNISPYDQNTYDAATKFKPCVHALVMSAPAAPYLAADAEAMLGKIRQQRSYEEGKGKSNELTAKQWRLLDELLSPFFGKWQRVGVSQGFAVETANNSDAAFDVLAATEGMKRQ